jgi:fructokinase
MFGAIEAGGTKFVCAVGDETGRIVLEERFPTTGPAATLAAVNAFLRRGRELFGALEAVGLASFGPIELRRGSAHFGTIGATPKPGWSSTDMVGAVAREFGGPIGFDTDVNAAALAELRWGAARDVDSLVYLTVGTGIGGGIVIGGAPVHGLMHPEIGHVFPRRHALDAGFAGVCPFHGDCLEGLASGPAIQARCGTSLAELAADHPQWEIEADYLGQVCALLVMTVSPRRLVLGGGVMSQTRLLPPIRQAMTRWLGGYVDREELRAGADAYVVAPGLGDRAGISGALALAIDAKRGSDRRSSG